jgi:HlyD family secretion protein
MLDIPKPSKEAAPVAKASGTQAETEIANRSGARVPRHLVLVAVLFILAGVAGLATWMMFLRPVTVEVAHVQSDILVQVFGLGTVEARVSSQVGFKLSGVLLDLRADVGDRIAKGSVLARLDDREQTAQVARAKAAVGQATANLERAKASVAKAKANYANADRINERRQKLVESRTASVETGETARAVRDAALGDLNLANSDVLVASAAIDDAEAQLQQQTATLDFHTLVAPYDAMIIARSKELGSALGAGQAVFTLIDPNTVWVLAFIDESKAGEMRVGQPAEIVLRSQPNRRIAGRVARIEPESDRVNEERKVEIAFDHKPDNFNLGEQAEVYITTVRLASALLVPEEAIEGFGSNSGSVWTLEDGHLQRQQVTFGHRLLDGRYEITGGLAPNSIVVTQLGRGLRVGRAAELSETRTSK